MNSLPQIVKGLAKVKAGTWITKSALRNPLLAVAVGGTWLGYKIWKDQQVKKVAQNGELHS